MPSSAALRGVTGVSQGVSLGVFVVRSTIAMVFIFTAAWKFARPSSFHLAVKALVPDVPVAPTVLAPVVAAGELIAAVLLVGPTAAQPVGGLMATVLLLAFTILLVRAPDVSAGCGCWFTTAGTRSKAPYIFRNALLLAGAVASAALPTNYDTGAYLILGPVLGAIVGTLVLELPTVSEFVS